VTAQVTAGRAGGMITLPQLLSRLSQLAAHGPLEDFAAATEELSRRLSVLPPGPARSGMQAALDWYGSHLDAARGDLLEAETKVRRLIAAHAAGPWAAGPTPTEIKLFLAELLLDQGRMDEFGRHLAEQDLKGRGPEADRWRLLAAEGLELTGDLEESLEMLSRVGDEDESTRVAAALLHADISLSLNRFDAARKEVRKLESREAASDVGLALVDTLITEWQREVAWRVSRYCVRGLQGMASVKATSRPAAREGEEPATLPAYRPRLRGWLGSLQNLVVQDLCAGKPDLAYRRCRLAMSDGPWRAVGASPKVDVIGLPAAEFCCLQSEVLRREPQAQGKAAVFAKLACDVYEERGLRGRAWEAARLVRRAAGREAVAAQEREERLRREFEASLHHPEEIRQSSHPWIENELQERFRHLGTPRDQEVRALLEVVLRSRWQAGRWPACDAEESAASDPSEGQAALAATSLSEPGTDEAQLPAEVERGTALVYYVSFEERLETIVCWQDRCVRLPERKQRRGERVVLRELVGKVIGELRGLAVELTLSRPPVVPVWKELCAGDGQGESTLCQLSAAMRLDEILALLPAETRRWVIVPDAALAYAPFAALPVRWAGKLEPLVKSHVPMVMPWPRVQPGRWQGLRPGATTVVTVPEPRLGADLLPRLPDEFVDRIESAVGAGRPQPPPSRGNFVKRLRGRSAVLLLCHGKANPAQPWRASLLLNDGPLEAHQIARQDLRDLDVMVTIACLSGDIEYPPGREPLGISSALLAAGVRVVVSPLWEVLTSSATAEFISACWKALAHGDPAEALAIAQRSMLAQEPVNLWSPYVAQVRAIPAGQSLRLAAAGPGVDDLIPEG